APPGRGSSERPYGSGGRARGGSCGSARSSRRRAGRASPARRCGCCVRRRSRHCRRPHPRIRRVRRVDRRREGTEDL
ncbi:MAG: hypothetical protein ACK56I_35060, partial [bacterium]